jgi:hypothetical protein
MLPARHGRVIASLAFLALGAPACHNAPEVPPPGSGANVITRAELDSAGTGSVYDVIARSHGLFLRDRGPTSLYGHSVPRAVVFIGDQYYGEIPTLRNLRAEGFAAVRYYSGTEAAAKFGSQYHGGVIQLLPRYY